MSDNFRSRAITEGLERAIELGFRNTNWLLHDPDLDNIRGHPRFMELVHKTENA